MKRNFFIFFAIVLLGAEISSGQVISLPAVNAYQPGVTLEQIMDSLTVHLNPSDSEEGGQHDELIQLQQFWQNRAVVNDSTASSTTHINMFSQYYGALYNAALARTTSTCGTGGYQGAWQVLGPLTAATQSIGRVDAICINPLRKNSIWAGTIGGLFVTYDGGVNWHCKTDGTVLAAGIAGISSIAIDPADTNKMFLGTSGTYSFIEPIFLNMGGSNGAAILKSTNGGATWQQELLPNDPSTLINEEAARVQRVYISPDNSMLFALNNNRIWYRSITGTTWSEITSAMLSAAPSGSTSFVNINDILFVSTTAHPNQFFVTAGLGNPSYSIYQCLGDLPYSNAQWSRITNNTGFTYSRFDPSAISTSYHSPLTESNVYQLRCAAYTNDIIYVLGNDISVNIPSTSIYYSSTQTNYRHSFLFTYTISTQTWTQVNTTTVPGGGYNVYPEFDQGKIQIAVTQGIGNTAGAPNIYIGGTNLWQSYDGGVHFYIMNGYTIINGSPIPITHSDTRDIQISAQATSGSHGNNDILYIATDGGVSEKPSGVDISTTTNPTIDISGTGLACGEFWNIATSEAGGLAAGGMQHDGDVAYEPTANPPWINLAITDAYRAIFDHDDPTKAYMTDGFPGQYEHHYETTSSGGSGGRTIGALGVSHYPAEDHIMPVLTMDNTNHHHMGLYDLWLYTPSTSPYWKSQTASPLNYGLPTSTQAQTIAFSPNYYTSKPVGYVVYQMSGGHQQVYYRKYNALSGAPFGIVTTAFENGTGLPAYPINEIATDPANTDRVWIAQGGIGYSGAKYRVNYSPNGGTTWYDISYGLPGGMPVSCIVYDEIANVLYCATDVGIYTYNFNNFNASGTVVNGVNQSASWTCFNKGISGGPDFPNAIVTHLEINRCQGKLFASTYGRSIWTTDLYPTSTTIPPVSDVISTNTIWSSTLYIKGCITVNSGKTLTITGTTVHMPKNGQIMVQPGGKLIVTNSTLTNDCQGCMWYGIQAQGNSSQQQYPTYQAAVTITNSTVENAKNAVILSNDANSTQNGGIVQATNSTFANNTRGVVFAPYHNTQGSVEYPNVSYFKNCNFTLDNNYRGDQFNQPFNCMASLQNVEGVSFQSCYFTNSNSNMADAGTGISSYDAGFTVGVYCSSYLSIPCTTSPRSTFSGFATGVNIGGDLSYNPTITVDKSDFMANSVGIFVNTVRNVAMTNNTFGIGSGFYVYEVATSGTYCHQNIGIYCKNTWQFKQESNSFSGHTSTANSAYSDWTNFGSVVENSSSPGTPIRFNATMLDNQIYKSTFTTLNFACYAIGNNGGNGANHGLSYLCNTYNGNTNDIYVVTPAPGGIRPSQGSFYSSASNTFTGGTAHIVNNGAAFTYWFNGSGTPYPATYNVAYMSASAASGCYTTLGSGSAGASLQPGYVVQGNINANLSAYATSAASFATDAGNLYGLMDAGNTDSLVGIINTTTDESALTTILSGISPYISQKPLLALSNTSVLSRSGYLSILDANPESLRDDGFLATLSASSYYPLSPSDVSALKTASTAVMTGRTYQESTVGDEHTAMSLAANEILLGMKNAIDPTDSTGTAVGTDSTSIYYGLDSNARYVNMAALGTWLNGVSTLWAQYELLGYYSDVHNVDSTTNADNALSNAATYIATLDTPAQNEYSNYQTLWTVLKGERTTGVAIQNMSSTDSTTLAGIAAFTTPSVPSAMAYTATNTGSVGLVLGSFSITKPPIVSHFPCFFPSLGGRAAPTQVANTPINAINSIRSKSQVSVFPNPASDIVTFKYQLTNTEGRVVLKIKNELGEIVNQQNVTNSIGSVVIDLNHLPNALYVFTITDDNGMIANGKIIKN